MMKSVNIWLLSMLIFSAASAQPFSSADYKKDNNSLLWEISGKKLTKPSFLFGTFHLMCKEDISFSKNLLKAIDYSSSLYFEIDLDDPANTLGALRYMYMNDGTTLKKLFDSSHYEKIKKFFSDSLKMGMQMIEKMKPAFSSSLIYPYLMKCDAVDGIEMELMKKSKELKKDISGFETMAFQAAVFDKIPYQEQANELFNMIDSIGNYRDNLNKMLVLYHSQQLDQIEASFSEEAGFESQKDDLLVNRNKNWVNMLKTILPEKNIFIAVGAGHLPGNTGLIALLRKEGYILKPVVNNN